MFNGRRGFTLVEILIVVIILGILAAIVIPQFSPAAEASRKAALVDQLQMLRVQIQLYTLQHDDTTPGLTGDTWDDLLNRSAYGGKDCGPYLQSVPRNPVNKNTAVLVIAADANYGDAVAGAGVGYVYNPTNGMIWATNSKGDKVYNEYDPDDPNN